MGCAEVISFEEVCARKRGARSANKCICIVTTPFSQNEKHSLILKKARAGVWLMTGRYSTSSRSDQNEPQNPPQLPLRPVSASAMPNRPTENQKPRLLFECNTHTLTSKRHFHTMLRRRQIDDYPMRVAHGPRPESVAYGRVRFSSDVDTIEIRQVIEVVDRTLCVHIRDAHTADLKAFHGKLILFTIVQRQCAITPLGSHASCDRGGVKRDFSRLL